MINKLAKYGLEYNPFVKGSHDIKIELEEYKQILFRLRHLENTKGIGLITGDPGLGKTTALRYWTNSLNKSLYKIVYIPHSTVTIMEFYRILCDELGLEVFHSKRKNFKNIQEEIKRLVIEKRITPVIILDEANYIPSDTLNDLKILLNFEMDSRDNIILLLVGQKVILSTLSRGSFEPLRQRISMNYNISPLGADECRHYVDTKLQAAGLNTPILTTESYNLVTNASKGVPRVINQIMDKALLLLASNKDKDEIDQDMMLGAIDEISF